MDEQTVGPWDEGLRRRCHELLAGYCGCLPEELGFSYGPWGKPLVATGDGRRVFHSISHSGRRAAVAVCLDGEVGIDIEAMRPGRRFADVVAYAFSPEEIAALDGAESEERTSLFYDLWTKKEALIKAAGASVAVHMDRTSVTGRAGENGWTAARIRGLAGCWFVRSVEVLPGYAGAVCAAAPASVVVVRACTPG
jgi:4'-phosphopantetheinyl transferase